LNLENTKAIEKFCRENDAEILGKLPFDPIMTKSMVAGTTLPEFSPEHELVKMLEKMWKRVESIVKSSQ